MNKTKKANNHLLPRLIIKKWEKSDGRLYNKKTKRNRKIKYEDYSKKYYYSLGKVDDVLENRISVFENKIAPILAKVDDAEKVIRLTGKEVELLKLFCVLAACRQDNTSSLIKNDESGIYKDNNYIFGVPLIKTQEEAVGITGRIIDDFDRINALSDSSEFNNWSRITTKSNNSFYTLGQHLVVLRNENNSNIISDICAVIECTMDSDYLFTYVPISPKTSLVLVKSKYYDNYEEYLFTLQRFGRKYGSGNPDPYISAIFEKREHILFNSYSSVRSAVHVNETYIKIKNYNNVVISIKDISLQEIRQFNSIFFEDGEKIVFTNEEELNFAKTIPLNSRNVILKW